jgi:hypothetical protein
VNPNQCPRCNENAIKTTITPERAIKIAPKVNVLHVGDKREYNCGFCGWWSRGAWNGQIWQWVTAPKISPRQREHLMLRLERVKRKRRAFGGKGR